MLNKLWMTIPRNALRNLRDQRDHQLTAPTRNLGAHHSKSLFGAQQTKKMLDFPMKNGDCSHYPKVQHSLRSLSEFLHIASQINNINNTRGFLLGISEVNYYKYKNFTSYFDYPLHDTALNTSGAFNGRAFDDLVFAGLGVVREWG
jgi:hypothetical protein